MASDVVVQHRGIGRADGRIALSATAARLVVLGAVGVGVAAGLLAGGDTAGAVAQAGDDLTRLLRAMAAIKALLATGLLAGALWRLAAPVTAPLLAGYALAAVAVAAGPVLIWGMAHVAAGALATHAGLLAGVVLLWRDKAVGARLAAILAARRARGRMS